jgi:hypothetical protein
MSTSTDALLFYGICWDEEGHTWPWNREDDDDDADQLFDDDLDDEEREEKYELHFGTHCLASNPMGFAAIPSTFVRSNRGYPVRIDEKSEDRDHLPTAPKNPLKDWNAKLKTFCEDYGYDFDELVEAGRVGWFICSDADID